MSIVPVWKWNSFFGQWPEKGFPSSDLVEITLVNIAIWPVMIFLTHTLRTREIQDRIDWLTDWLAEKDVVEKFSLFSLPNRFFRRRINKSLLGILNLDEGREREKVGRFGLEGWQEAKLECPVKRNTTTRDRETGKTERKKEGIEDTGDCALISDSSLCQSKICLSMTHS